MCSFNFNHDIWIGGTCGTAPWGMLRSGPLGNAAGRPREPKCCKNGCGRGPLEPATRRRRNALLQIKPRDLDRGYLRHAGKRENGRGAFFCNRKAKEAQCAPSN